MQGQMLAVRNGWKWLSTGEILRSSKDPAIIDFLKTGELVSDEMTYELFANAVAEANAAGYENIIVDGFPRTKDQADWFHDYLVETGQRIDVVIALEVAETEIMRRLALRGRNEDTPETIERRMQIYRQKMYPILGRFAEEGIKIVHLEGVGTAGAIHDRIYEQVMEATT